MKDLFEDLYMGFFEEQLQVVTENKQAYFDNLTEMLVMGHGYLPNNTSFTSRELVERDLTEDEEAQLYFRLSIWLDSLN